MQRLVERLYEIGSVKFGRFILKSGKVSNYYIDLRILPSYPSVFLEVSNYMKKLIEDSGEKVDRICGIATGGLPLAVSVGIQMGLPILYTRKAKKYGTKNSVEGVIKNNDSIVIIDDVITTGKSKIEAKNLILNKAKEEGIKVSIPAVYVVVDREEGGKEFLEKNGLKLYSLIRKKHLNLIRI